MKKRVVLVLCIFVFCLGFSSNLLLTQINKENAPFFLKWGCNTENNIESFSFDDKNGLIIMGNYNSEGFESFSIYYDKKDYHQCTVFGKTFDGSIDDANPPESNEIVEIDSFLTRTESINNQEIKYYIDNSSHPKIIFDNKVE